MIGKRLKTATKTVAIATAGVASAGGVQTMHKTYTTGTRGKTMTLLTTEEWVAAYLKAEDTVLYAPEPGQRFNPEVRVILALIRSIHDLQQQITELQEASNDRTTHPK